MSKEKQLLASIKIQLGQIQKEAWLKGLERKINDHSRIAVRANIIMEDIKTLIPKNK